MFYFSPNQVCKPINKSKLCFFSTPEQICAGAVQRPLLADVWSGYTGQTIMSTHSFCGAQPDVQLHHEHVVTKIYREGCVGEGRHLREEEKLKTSRPPPPKKKTEENCKNHTRLRSWILHRDGILDGCSKLRWVLSTVAVTVWDSPVPCDSETYA